MPLIAILLLLLTACSSQRVPIKPGEIPNPQRPTANDERYGQKVLAQLASQFPIERNPRFVVPAQPWSVYVLRDREMLNAAATRGNYLFVWTEMIRYTRDDAELAAVMAHEIAHILAQHTHATSGEEINEILSGVAGQAASSVIAGSSAAGAAGIAGSLISQTLKGVLVNPNSQRLESEADQIGLFLMAEAGYPPAAAVNFWSRASRDPRWQRGSTMKFFSTHPPLEERLVNLRRLLPKAEKRYHSAREYRRLEKSKETWGVTDSPNRPDLWY
jgi:predicted Zn-dependent protease